MGTEKIIKFCMEKGFLVDRDVLNLFNDVPDFDSVKILIEGVRTFSRSKIITKEIFDENKSEICKVFFRLPHEKQKNLEKLRVKLGLSIEISKEDFSDLTKEESEEKNVSGEVKVLSSTNPSLKKIEVKDFVSYFKGRFNLMKNILQEHAELKDLVSINKISNNKKNFSVVGIVLNKRVTKNKNILFEIEDLTGKINVLINSNKEEVYKKAEEVSLDSVLGFKCSGSSNILFANDIVFPESFLPERKKSNLEEYALFLGDLHFGSKLFLRENFLKFIDYLNGKFSDTPEVGKIKYLFLVGDIVTGVGNYPNQEKDLVISNLEDQFSQLAQLLSQIRKDIKIIISPGNHDGVRIMEPQPFFDEKFAWPLYELENVVLTPNPSYVNIGANNSFSGFNVLSYHGVSFPFYANNVSSLMVKKSMNFPEEIMKYLLKNRHLAPTHSSTQYYPYEEDELVIKTVPDIFVSAHTHKSGISYYNNVLVISVSCWEAMTSYQEKFGNKPDHCKVPMFNLKTRAVRILDFE